MFWNNKNKKKSSTNRPPLAASSGTQSQSSTQSSPAEVLATSQPSPEPLAEGSLPLSDSSSSHAYFQKAYSALSEGTVIQGSLSFDRAVRIDGTLNGKVFSSDALLLGSTSKVKADIDVRTLVVEGAFAGSAHARERIVLLASARVEADITAPSIVIEQGATFEGRCSMPQHSSKNTPQRDTFETRVLVHEEEEIVVATSGPALEQEIEQPKKSESAASLH